MDYNYVFMGNKRICKYRPNVVGRYYINDIRGSAAAIVDSDASIDEGYAYEPFGSTWQAIGATEEFRYTGKELDYGHGMKLYYYGARYYDSDLGRFFVCIDWQDFRIC